MNQKSNNRPKYLCALTCDRGCISDQRVTKLCVEKIKLGHTFPGIWGRIPSGLNIDMYKMKLKSFLMEWNMGEFPYNFNKGKAFVIISQNSQKH